MADASLVQQAASQSAPTTGVGRLHASETALFVCDIQEKFRPIIAGMPAVIDTARRMVTPPFFHLRQLSYPKRTNGAELEYCRFEVQRLFIFQ